MPRWLTSILRGLVCFMFCLGMNEFIVRKSRSKKSSSSTGLAFGRKKDIWDNHDLNEWMVKEDVCLAYLWGLRSSLRFLRVERIFMQKTNVLFDWLFRQLPFHLSWWYLLITFSKTAMQRAIASAISQTAEQIISIMNKVTLNAWKWSRGLLNWQWTNWQVNSSQSLKKCGIFYSVNQRGCGRKFQTLCDCSFTRSQVRMLWRYKFCFTRFDCDPFVLVELSDLRPTHLQIVTTTNFLKGLKLQKMLIVYFSVRVHIQQTTETAWLTNWYSSCLHAIYNWRWVTAQHKLYYL